MFYNVIFKPFASVLSKCRLKDASFENESFLSFDWKYFTHVKNISNLSKQNRSFSSVFILLPTYASLSYKTANKTENLHLYHNNAGYTTSMYAIFFLFTFVIITLILRVISHKKSNKQKKTFFLHTLMTSFPIFYSNPSILFFNWQTWTKLKTHFIDKINSRFDIFKSLAKNWSFIDF